MSNLVQNLERSILSAMMSVPAAMDGIKDALSKITFSSGLHQQLYQLLQRMRAEGATVDIVTVAAELANVLLDKSYDPFPLVAEISNAAGAPENIQYYVQQLLQARYAELADKACMNFLKHNTKGLSERLCELREELVFLEGQDMAAAIETYDYMLGESFTLLNRSQARSQFILPIGYRSFAKYLPGWTRGSLHVLAARPSMGKSMLALNFAENLSVMKDHVGIFFTMEMPCFQLVNRTLSRLTQVPYEVFTNFSLEGQHWASIETVVPLLKKCKLILREKNANKLSEIRRFCRQVKNEMGLDYVVVDYLSLIQDESKAENENLRLGHIAAELKKIAMDFKIPVICIAQLNRNVENRQDKRPMMSDLRQSGEIEQHADVVMFLYREHYYTKMPYQQQEAEVIIAKNRNGRIGTVAMKYRPETMEFNDA